MKYIVRLLATLPAVCVAITTMLCIGIVIECELPIVVLIAVGNFYAIAILLKHYEQTVQALAKWFKRLGESALDFE